MTDRVRLGAAGERIAARFLTDHGLKVVACNVEIGKGELDLVATDRGERVVVEVRTITGPGDPIEAIGHAKRARVRSLARRTGAGRVDFLGVGMGPEAVVIHWVPDCG